jgi:hypothetical protein
MLFDSISCDYFNFQTTPDGKFINITGPDVQAPKMRCNQGVTTFMTDYGANRYYIDLEMHESERLDLFRTWMDTFDEHVKKHVQRNSLEIFGHVKTLDEIGAMFKKSTTGDAFKLKLDEGTIAKNKDGEHSAVLNKGSLAGNACVVVARPKLIYFINNMFGVSWYAAQIAFAPAKVKPQKYMFLD